MRLFKNLFTREKWLMVKVINSKFQKDKKTLDFWFKLYESNKGRRRVEFSSSDVTLNRDYGELTQLAKIFPVYNEKVLRWESGRYDPDISTYYQIGEEDLINVLKGKI